MFLFYFFQGYFGLRNLKDTDYFSHLRRIMDYFIQNSLNRASTLFAFKCIVMYIPVCEQTKKNVCMNLNLNMPNQFENM